MIWVAYGIVTAALLGLAALVLETLLRSTGRAGRWIWLCAQAASLALFALALGGWTPFGWTLRSGWGLAGSPSGASMESGTAAGFASASVLWLAASAAAVLLLVVESLRLRLRSRRWREGRLGGMPVLVSSDVGPATLGLFRSRIVVPAWVFGLGSRARRLILLHEGEHRRAGDVRLLVGSALLVAAMPWNPLLWWQLSRLQRAVELDCDARVLRRVRDRRGYGHVLLEAGARSCGVGRLIAGLAPRRSLLEERVAAVAVPARTRGSRVRLFAAAVALAAACAAPAPTAPESGGAKNVIAERPAGTVDRPPGGTFRYDSTRIAGTIRRVAPGDVGQAVMRVRESTPEEAGRRRSPRVDTLVMVPGFGRVTRVQGSR